ncbi:MAG: pentapeptide repeat-containing protein, partial [Cyanobacteria bacterium P01_H01_bin.150]
NADKQRLEELELEIDLRHDKKALHEFIKKIAIPTLTTNNHNPSFIIIADQFEELYTLTPPEQRQPFLDTLLYAVKFTPLFTLVLTMRADFYGKAIAYRPFSDALQEGLYNLAPMNFDELESAISEAKRLRRNAKPAQAMKVDLEEGLMSRLIKDIANQPGLLPLLQFALTQLWEKQKNWFLIHQAYEEIGGIEKALANHADAVFYKLSAADKKRVERIFVQLVRLGEGVEDTRRVANRAEVGEENWDLVDYLAGEKARLLVTGRNETTGEETVEIVHEALIGNWLLLREWVDKIREQLRFKQRIEDAAAEWERRKKPKDYLLRGILLEEAKGFRTGTVRNMVLSTLALLFIEKSYEQRRNNLIKTAGLSLIVPTLFTISLGIEGVEQVKISQLRNTVEAAKGQIVSSSRNQALEELIKLGISLERISLKNADLSNTRLSNPEFNNKTNLSGANLSGVNLNGANLSDANLSDTNLSGANLNGTNLNGANLAGVIINSKTKLDAKWHLTWEIVNQKIFDKDLRGADLSDANLQSANVKDVDLGNAKLRNTNLEDAKLGDANLSNADLSNANLRGAFLYNAKLSNAKLISASLESAKLSSANLSDADFRNANIRYADFSDAKLNDADLRNTELFGTRFNNADLSGTKLRSADLGYATDFTGAKNLTVEQVKSAKNWAEAKYDKEFRAKLGLPPEKQHSITHDLTEEEKSKWEKWGNIIFYIIFGISGLISLFPIKRRSSRKSDL